MILKLAAEIQVSHKPNLQALNFIFFLVILLWYLPYLQELLIS